MLDFALEVLSVPSAYAGIVIGYQCCCLTVSKSEIAKVFIQLGPGVKHFGQHQANVKSFNSHPTE